ncbi:hypothetical protein ABZX51_006957 [Aspergillus tubingensis]
MSSPLPPKQSNCECALEENSLINLLLPPQTKHHVAEYSKIHRILMTAQGFALANNGLALYDVLSQSPTRAATFAASKRGYISGAAMGMVLLVISIQPLLSTLPADSVVVDVGGVQGDISFALVAAFPHLRFIVQDLPGVIARVKEQQIMHPSSATRRVDFQAHDFFTPSTH